MTAHDAIDVSEEFLADLPPSPTGALTRHALIAGDPPLHRRVFVNRTLRMSSIRVVGFDLDWTLADYHRLAMERLAFDLTRDRLVEALGYPDAVRQAEFRPDFPRRGLMIDREQGTVLKMNRHRYVGRAYLGRRRLSREERRRLYRSDPINPASQRFYRVDTLFELPEVNLYSEIVEMSLADPPKVALESYEKLFRDVRAAIDSVHADDSLKSRIMDEPARYVPRDPNVALALRRMAMGGRRVILITNSEWYYTDALCKHLFDGILPGVERWTDLFDLVIVRSAKPGFFRERRPFIELGPGGEHLGEVEVPRWGGRYEGGCRDGLMELLACPGEQVLYVGDHIYGDIVASKLRSTWRAALIVKELEEELRKRVDMDPLIRREIALKQELAALGWRMDAASDVLALYDQLASEGAPVADAAVAEARALRDRLQALHKTLRGRVAVLHERISTGFNPLWGSLFRQGGNQSLFGSQVDDFACVYTSRAANFAWYGSDHYYRVLRDPLMHDLEAS